MYLILLCILVNPFYSGINAVNDVNNALSLNDRDAVLLALQNPALQLQNVEPRNITHYLRLLNKKKDEKVKDSGDPHVALWIDEIQACIDVANRQTKLALKRKKDIYVYENKLGLHHVVNLNDVFYFV